MIKNRHPLRSERKAFSLVEVTLALGIATFALLIIVGMLPLGLKMVRESAIDQATADIATQIRTGLQNLTFANTHSFDPAYYTKEGIFVDTDEDGFDDVFFTVTMEEERDAADKEFAGAKFDRQSMRLISVTMEYPYNPNVSAAQLQKRCFSLFIANQTGAGQSQGSAGGNHFTQ